jgi:hypothetical protein
MADFCTKCSHEMFGNDIEPEINVQEIFESLELGFASSGYLCEGCGLVSIAKNEDGDLQVMRIPIDENEETLSIWEEY